MEHWDKSILDINGTCANFDQKCLQLLGMHALSGFDTSSYPYGKRRVSSLNIIETMNVKLL